MCGLSGIWQRRPGPADALAATAQAMAETLRHRGPDDAGVFVDGDAGVAFGHRRLAVIDLSPTGHQPMASADGRYVVSFNGEVYNHPELRAELRAASVTLRGSSDTEVLVECIARFGVQGALERATAMLALAVWDRAERVLTLAVDRFGEKPLYYAWLGDSFVFGSELKALRCHPDFHAEIDRDVLALYLRHNCVPAPHSIYRGVAKLAAGTLVRLDATTAPGRLPVPVAYWRLDSVLPRSSEPSRPKGVPSPSSPPSRGEVSEFVDELEAVLSRAVGMRMHADVPVGAFLSGGIDSSLVTALMQARQPGKVRTFTMALEEAAFDEADNARAVADHLGTEHVELTVTAADALACVVELPRWYDEPFADSSQIPTALLSRLTRRHVTVALSGDGGDELFGGYNRYLWAQRFWSRLGRLPGPLRRAGARAIEMVPPAAWDRAYAVAEPALPRALRVRMPGSKLHKVARVLPAADLAEVHLLLASHFTRPEAVVLGAAEAPSRLSRPDAVAAGLDPVAAMMYLDTLTYLPDDILTKVDRATMASSLEARVPFLDPAVAAFAWTVPTDLKIRDGRGKWLLRQLLHRYVPEAIVERPKMGFGIPLADWLRGPLRPWVEDLLAPGRLGQEGYLEPTAVRRVWDAHLSGRGDHHGELWDLLVFQAWLETSRV